jgi:hypothetical protein
MENSDISVLVRQPIQTKCLSSITISHMVKAGYAYTSLTEGIVISSSDTSDDIISKLRSLLPLPFQFWSSQKKVLDPEQSAVDHSDDDQKYLPPFYFGAPVARTVAISSIEGRYATGYELLLHYPNLNKVSWEKRILYLGASFIVLTMINILTTLLSVNQPYASKSKGFSYTHLHI